jgi:hypothetical protein
VRAREEASPAAPPLFPRSPALLPAPRSPDLQERAGAERGAIPPGEGGGHLLSLAAGHRDPPPNLLRPGLGATPSPQPPPPPPPPAATRIPRRLRPGGWGGAALGRGLAGGGACRQQVGGAGAAPRLQSRPPAISISFFLTTGEEVLLGAQLLRVREQEPGSNPTASIF